MICPQPSPDTNLSRTALRRLLGRRFRVSRAAPVAVVGLVALCISIPAQAGAARPNNGAAQSPYTATLAQTTGLTDGSPDPVAVTSSSPGQDPVGEVDIRLCRPGVAYTSYAVVETRGNCGFSPGSSAFTSDRGSATQDFPGEPSGASSFPDNFIMGVGTSTFAGFSLTCDATDPCDLVVSVFDSAAQAVGGTANYIKVFPLTFQAFGSVAGCGGISAAALQTASSERLVDSYTDWSRQACTTEGPGAGLAPTENTFLGEGGPGSAVDEFATGSVDMAYAAGGYGLPGFAETGGRPYVAVPVGVNAVVIASSGGQQVPAYTPPRSPKVTNQIPFSSLEITAEQAASIFGGGFVTSAEAKVIDKENPELLKGEGVVPFVVPGTAILIYPLAVSGVDATTDFDTSYFKQIAGSAWNSGPNHPAGTPKNVARGTFSSFADPGSDPPFDGNITTYSHRTDLEKDASQYLGVGPQPEWTLTDRATATQLGLTVASVHNDIANVYTAPTAATMDAAVADMTAQPDGTLVPNPVAAQKDPKTAYPLTFVEYALVPTEPLVDATCATRSASEQLMIQWLKFLAGPGQNNMAPGLEPLTPSLQAAAAAAIAKVGTAAETGACAPKSVTTTPTTTTPAKTIPTKPGVTTPSSSTSSTSSTSTTSSTLALSGNDFPISDTPSGGGVAGAGSSVAAGVQSRPALNVPTTPQGASKTSSPGTSTTTAPTTSVSGQKLAEVRIPGFAGRLSSSWALSVVALLILGLLSGGIALRLSGWSPPPTVTRVLHTLRLRR